MKQTKLTFDVKDLASSTWRCPICSETGPAGTGLQHKCKNIKRWTLKH